MKKLYIYLSIAISFTLFYFIWLLFSPERMTTIGAGTLSLIAPIAALVLQIYTFRKSSGILQKFIALFIIGTAFYLLAEVIWAIQVLLFDHSLPFPGISDLFYFSSTLLFITAFFYIVSTNNERFHFISFLLDITIIYFTVTSIFILQFLLPLFFANGLSSTEALVSALYPALDILLLIVMIICFIYKKKLFNKPTKALFIFAAANLIFGDTVFKITYYHSLFTINSLIEPIWSFNILLFSIAIFATIEISLPKSQVSTLYYNFKANLYRMLVQSACIILLVYMTIQFTSDYYELVLFGVVLLILIRQVISSYCISNLLHSISKMNNSLEQTVLKRTKALSEKNKELSAALEKINYMAFHDELTNLPNRRSLHEKFSVLKKDSQPFSVVFIDVNKFKEINDTFGHACGDEVLKVITGQLKEVIQDSGTIYRQAGDEFIIIIENSHRHLLENILCKISACSASSIDVLEKTLFVCFSIGVAHYPEHTEDIDEIIKLADIAMYRSKKGALNYCYYK